MLLAFPDSELLTLRISPQTCQLLPFDGTRGKELANSYAPPRTVKCHLLGEACYPLHSFPTLCYSRRCAPL